MRLHAAPIAAVLALASPSAVADSPERVRGGLCERYEGVFRWDAPDSLAQIVRAEADSITIAKGAVVATGRGSYTTVSEEGKPLNTTEMKFSWRIDPVTLAIVMRESGPDTSGFVDDGAYTGTISADLYQIEATWRTEGTGETGRVTLRADPSCMGGS